MNNNARPYKFLGISDERLTCECCGRENLKRTVAVLFQDSQEVLYFGTSCAARALSLTSKEVERSAKGAQAQKEAAEAEARQAARFQRELRFSDWLQQNFGVRHIGDAVRAALGKAAFGKEYISEVKAISSRFTEETGIDI